MKICGKIKGVACVRIRTTVLAGKVLGIPRANSNARLKDVPTEVDEA
jgi:hypothetical protein